MDDAVATVNNWCQTKEQNFLEISAFTVFVRKTFLSKKRIQMALFYLFCFVLFCVDPEKTKQKQNKNKTKTKQKQNALFMTTPYFDFFFISFATISLLILWKKKKKIKRTKKTNANAIQNCRK